jgi:hypothetical protein
MRQRSMSVVQPTSFRSAQPRPFDRESWRLVIKALHGPQVMQGRGASPLTYACARSELEHQANEGTTNFQVSGPACMRRGCLNAQHLTVREVSLVVASPRHSLTTINSVRPSSPPSMHAKHPRSKVIVCSTSPPSRTRTQRFVGDVAVPDRILRVDADPVRHAVAQLGPYPPVRQAAERWSLRLR